MTHALTELSNVFLCSFLVQFIKVETSCCSKSSLRERTKALVMKNSLLCFVRTRSSISRVDDDDDDDLSRQGLAAIV